MRARIEALDNKLQEVLEVQQEVLEVLEVLLDVAFFLNRSITLPISKISICSSCSFLVFLILSCLLVSEC